MSACTDGNSMQAKDGISVQWLSARPTAQVGATRLRPVTAMCAYYADDAARL